jgi:hypothetical protein
MNEYLTVQYIYIPIRQTYLSDDPFDDRGS